MLRPSSIPSRVPRIARSVTRRGGRARSALAAAGLGLALALGGGGCAGDSRPGEEARILADTLLERRAGGEELRLVRIDDGAGTVHEGWLRFVPDPGSPYRMVIVLGGIVTAERAAEIVPCPPGFAILALDYAYHGPRRPSRAAIFRNVPEIRRASTRTTRGLHAAIRIFSETPPIPVEPRGALVIGASFGAPFVLKAIAELPRERGPEGEDLGPAGVRAVAILFAGADLPEMARYRMRELPWWEREAVAGTLALLFADMEPARHVGAISPRPLLLVNGENDEFISPEAGRALARAAGEPVKQIWLPSAHMQPDAVDLLQELVRRTLRWLAEQEGAAGEEATGGAPAGGAPAGGAPRVSGG